MFGKSFSRALRAGLLGTVAAGAVMALSAPAQAIIVRDDVGLVASEDPADVWAPVAQIFFLNNGTGGIFFNCTGTLINPRTILTAAHCLNDVSSEAYDLPGFAPFTMLVGFGPNTLGPLLNFANFGDRYWDGGVALSTDVIIHPSANLDTPGALPFPWADVAMIALDQPVYNIAPMAMLLTPLDQLVHTVMGGYGGFGTGTTGNVGISTRRLIGENMLGMIGANTDLIDVIFPGFAPSAVTLGFDTQTMYFIDFDDPTRTPALETACTFTGFGISCPSLAAARAIDWFDDDALPREVGTAGGDSGSALIADDIFGEPLILGVLSGGWDFFSLGNQYGDISFYNPLFAFSQFLIENNPYKFVAAAGGDGDWFDPAHWVQLGDPGYMCGDVGSGIALCSDADIDALRDETGVFTTTPKEGSVLGVDISGNDDTPSPFLPPAPASAGGAAAALSLTPLKLNATAYTGYDLAAEAMATLTGLTGRAVKVAGPGLPSPETPGFGNDLPQSSAALGAGSTGFVPVNDYGISGTAFANPAQFFDVNLVNPGTTTLNGFVPEIDRLTLAGGSLDIQEFGDIAVLMEVSVFGGTLNNDGFLATSDIFGFGGLISGNGVFFLGFGFTAPTLTSTMFLGTATLTAGGIGDAGSMLVFGNVSATAAATMWFDVDGVNADFLNIFGDIDLAGTAFIQPVAGYVPTLGDTFVIADAFNVNGTFDAVASSLVGAIQPELTYTATQVILGFQALSFFDVAAITTPDATAVAGALDGARGAHYGDLIELYTVLDLLGGADLIAALESLTPDDVRAAQQFTLVNVERLDALIGSRTASTRFGGGEGFAFDLTPGIQVASLDADGAFQVAAAALAAMDGPAGDAGVMIGGKRFGGFFGMSGSSGDAAIGNNTNDAGFDSFAMAGGLDYRYGPNFLGGLALGYADTEGTLPGAPRGAAEASTFQVTAYGQFTEGGFFVDGRLSYQLVELETRRTVTVGPSTFRTSGDTDGDGFSVSLLGGYTFSEDGEMPFVFTPMAGLRYTDVSIDGYTETGSVVSLAVDGYDVDSLEGRIGASVGLRLPEKGGTTITPTLTAFYVHDFEGGNDAVTAAFLGAPTFAMGFAGAEADDSWFELAAEVDIRFSDEASLTFGYETTLSRGDLDYGTISGRFSFRF